MAGLPPDVIAYQIAHIDDNKTDSIIASNVITLFAACVAVVLRLCSRFLKRLTLQPDDYLILAALVTASIQSGESMSSVPLVIANPLSLKSSSPPLSSRLTLRVSSIPVPLQRGISWSDC